MGHSFCNLLENTTIQFSEWYQINRVNCVTKYNDYIQNIFKLLENCPLLKTERKERKFEHYFFGKCSDSIVCLFM